MVLEIIIIKFSCILKRISRNTFPEPQPDSVSYSVYLFVLAFFPVMIFFFLRLVPWVLHPAPNLFYTRLDD